MPIQKKVVEVTTKDVAYMIVESLFAAMVGHPLRLAVKDNQDGTALAKIGIGGQTFVATIIETDD